MTTLRAPQQRIVKIRRDYNRWVANETMEDYALRFTPRSFRKWSEFRVANTALGSVSFLALEAIGGAIALNYGFSNAFWAIVVVGLIIFATGLPISYYAAKYGVDMDLLTRGAGFGYIGSTITSLIYAGFTFIFFAIEAAIMAMAIEMYFGLPLSLGYLVSALVIIPLVTHGITFISRLQVWTQPLWLVLSVLPFAFVYAKNPGIVSQWTSFAGKAGEGGAFDPLLFGAAATVSLSLIMQIGEQVDFLRFLPEKKKENRARWWTWLVLSGPGWIIPGALKQLGGAFLVFLALQHEIGAERAVEPTQMYLVGFQYVFSSFEWALAATTLFVLLSQIKINVTNAYAGSLAWSNFFARLTHSHPGRVVWLVFNVLIAVMLMELGVFDALEEVLGLYSSIAIAWIGALVADLVINKPLGLSPKHIEFKRAHLYDVNPVGVGSMLIASAAALAAHAGLLGAYAQAFAPFIALGVAFVMAPVIAWLTGGRYYIARQPAAASQAIQECCICNNSFESEDMAHCPAYGGAICSLCCSLDARCGDICKPRASFGDQTRELLRWILPTGVSERFHTRLAHYLLGFGLISCLLAGTLLLVYFQEAHQTVLPPAQLRDILIRIFAALMVIAGIAVWWLVLTKESRQVAQEESNRQTHLLTQEIEAHRRTDAELQEAKEVAERANRAKSRFVTAMSHELRTPLNSILGFAQLLEKDASLHASRKDSVKIIRRSGEHLLALIDGLLDIAKIEAGRLELSHDEIRLSEFIGEIVQMFQPQARAKGLAFSTEISGRFPAVVRTDARRFRQILINLLGNAVKFTAHGAITLRCSHHGEMGRFEIEDSGVGMSAEELSRIFLPFEQGSAGAALGTGLGLTITKLLAELMGGEVSVRSNPGVGSVFQVRLFLPEVRNPRPVLELERHITGYTGARRRVMVVDDEPAHRALLDSLLGELGFEVHCEKSGENCLHAVSKYNPEAVLLDMAMPGLNGWATARKLRDEYTFTGPIIAVSAAFENDPLKLEAAGIQAFVVKPVDFNELLVKLGDALALEWERSAAPRHAPEAPPSEPLAQTLLELRQLADMGYLKGFERKLGEIAGDASGGAPWVRELRDLAKAFRVRELQDKLRGLEDGLRTQ
ncbi:MAG: ATP-binding protein [Burkholderiales bacterium]